MKKFLLPAFMAFALAFFVGCSDDDDNNPTSNDDSTYSLPATIFDLSKITGGSFTQVRTDSTNTEISDTKETGTFTVSGDTTINSLTGKIFTFQFANAETSADPELYLVSKDTNDFYVSSSVINNVVKILSPNSAINLPFTLPDTIIKIADRNNTQWNAYEKSFTDFSVTEFSGQKVTADGKLTLKCTRGTSSDETLNGVTTHSQIFNCVISFTGTISLDPSNVRTLTSLIQFRFTDNQGITYKYVPFSNFDVSIVSFPCYGLKWNSTIITQ